MACVCLEQIGNSEVYEETIFHLTVYYHSITANSSIMDKGLHEVCMFFEK
jgi:hypothetical protein